jgi:hypothetical protein
MDFESKVMLGSFYIKVKCAPRSGYITVSSVALNFNSFKLNYSIGAGVLTITNIQKVIYN